MSTTETPAMRFHSVSIVAGGLACNARCPFCIASMTPASGLGLRAEASDEVAVDQACAAACAGGTEQVMITSKGEPTLWPDHVTSFLRVLARHDFARIDLQTNGIPMADGKISDERLVEWRELGLSLIAISLVSDDPELNRANYLPYRASYIDLPALITRLHRLGFAVRLAVVMTDGATDSAAAVARLVAFSREHAVEQLTLRPVNRPADSRDDAVSTWIGEHYLRPDAKAEIAAYLAGFPLVGRLPWGGLIYDVAGQNVCLTNSLTHDDPAYEVGRQLIIFPDGRVSTSWETEAGSLDAALAA